MSFDKNELLWRQYRTHLDLYKTYLELLLKFNVFFYAITGAILSYYFGHQNVPYIKGALLLPMVLSLAFGAFLIYAGRLGKIVRQDVFSIRDQLELQVSPDFGVLVLLLYLFGALLIVVGAGLIFIVAKC